jgi:prepilin-type N-terminal cleavage/methylation domain-containing protein
MNATTRTTPPRRGFTLVELLVAMALIIFIMVILTEAFTAGTGVFRTLKSQGDMQEKLRAAIGLMRDDLRQIPGKQGHFGDKDPATLGTWGINGNTSPIQAGYFYIQQPAQQFLPLPIQFGSLPEGPASSPLITPGPQAQESLDAFSVRMNSPALALNGGQLSITSWPGLPAGVQPTAVLPALSFTNYRKGTQPQDYYPARIPGKFDYPQLPIFMPVEQQFFNPTGPNTTSPTIADYQLPPPLVNTTPVGLASTPLPMRDPTKLNSNGIGMDQKTGFLLSPWTEISYFLVPTGLTAGTTFPMPTYSLRRRLRVVVTDQTLQQAVNNAPLANRIPVNLWGPRYGEVSCLPDTTTGAAVLYFNTPQDLAQSPLPTNLAGPPPSPYLLPSCGPATVAMRVGAVAPLPGCQTMVPPLSPVPQGQQLTPLPQPQQVQQALVAFADPTTPATAQSQGRNDWRGDDIILTDVISFNIRVLALFRTGANAGFYSSDFVDLTDPSLNQPAGMMGTIVQGINSPPGFYNTATNPGFTITALEITLRVWDTKTSLTRQVTLIQDL